MKRENHQYIAIPLAIVLLFWSAKLAAAAIFMGALYFLHSRGLFRLLWKIGHRQKSGVAPVSAATPTWEGAEPTLITLVARAPFQLLGIDQDAGTSTIFHSFYQQVKEERGDGLKLNKKGRRLALAKNEMLARRRKQGRPETSSAKRAQLDLKNSLTQLLESRPVYEGKVLQFTNLSPSVAEKYHVGAEIEELGLTGSCGTPESETVGRGSCRFVIHSQSGRLLSSAGEGQVVFLPGTRFRVLSCKPWHNSAFPNSPPGFSYELEEVA